MITNVYVDGFNLYLGRLRGTSFKWLDVVKLMEELIRQQDPSSVVQGVCYFTAPVQANFARLGQASVTAQAHYQNALELVHGTRFEKVNGRHQSNQEYAMEFIPGAKPDKNKRVSVWRVVEKLTDVQLAMRMYRDVAKGKCAQVVLCGNDSDHVPVLRAIREDFPTVRIGVIAPLAPLAPAPDGSDRDGRRPLTEVQQHANWVRRSIPDNELASAQLPLLIPTNKKPIRKPAHW